MTAVLATFVSAPPRITVVRGALRHPRRFARRDHRHRLWRRTRHHNHRLGASGKAPRPATTPLRGCQGCHPQLTGAVVPVLWPFREGTADHRVEGLWDPGNIGDARRLLVQVGRDRRRGRIPVKGRGAHQARVQKATERVDVTARVGRFSAQLLRRHVVERSDPPARVRGARPLVGEPRDPEVRQIRVGVAEQNVRRFDVAMHQAPLVGRVERTCDLVSDLGCLHGRQPSPRTQQSLQVRPIDISHHQIEVAILLPRPVDGDHVWMIDRGHQSGLTLKTAKCVRVSRQFVVDQLDRNGPIE